MRSQPQFKVCRSGRISDEGYWKQKFQETEGSVLADDRLFQDARDGRPKGLDYGRLSKGQDEIGDRSQLV